MKATTLPQLTTTVAAKALVTANVSTAHLT
jgi:hypothetical protein